MCRCWQRFSGLLAVEPAKMEKDLLHCALKSHPAFTIKSTLALSKGNNIINNATTGKSLHIFDFDGTLFRSPVPNPLVPSALLALISQC